MFGLMMTMLMSLGWAEIDLNTATVAELSAVSTIDSAMAESIVAYRNSHNGIPNVEALRVLNLSESALDSLRAESIITLQVSTNRTKKFNSVEAVMAEF